MILGWMMVAVLAQAASQPAAPPDPVVERILGKLGPPSGTPDALRQEVMAAWAAAASLPAAVPLPDLERLWAETGARAKRLGVPRDRLVRAVRRERIHQLASAVRAATGGTDGSTDATVGAIHVLLDEALTASSATVVGPRLRAAWSTAGRLPDAEQDPVAVGLRREILWVALELGDDVVVERARDWFVAHPRRKDGKDDARDLCEAARQKLRRLRGEDAVRLLDRARAALAREPEPDPELSVEMLALTGAAKILLGAYSEARELLSRVEQEYLVRGRPAGDPDLLRTRHNLGIVLARLGHRHRALPLFEQVVAARRSTLPAEDPELQQALMSLSILKKDLGDLMGSLALIQSVVDVLTRTGRGPEDLFLQIARENLAVTLRELGDAAVALPILEDAVKNLERLQVDPGEILTPYGNLAALYEDLGDFERAAELDEKVLRGLEGREHSRAWRRACENLSTARWEAGRKDEADALLQQALAGMEPQAMDPGLLLALASSKARRGDLREARRLEEQACGIWSRELPPGHRDRLWAQRRLAQRCLQLGEAQAAAKHLQSLAMGWRSSLLAAEVSAREVGARIGLQICRDAQAVLFAALLGCGTLPPMPELAGDALLLLESVRGAEMGCARRMRWAATADPSHRALEAKLTDASAEVTRLGLLADQDDGQRRAHAEALRHRDRIQNELRALAVRARGGSDPLALTASELGRRIPEGAAAVAITRCSPLRWDKDGKEVESRDRFLALALRRDGTVTPLDLGDASEIEGLIAKARSRLGSPYVPTAPAAGEAGMHAGLEALRRVVLDPVLRAEPTTTTLFVSLDPALAVVPLDALPRDDGTFVGDQVTIIDLPSLLELAETPPALANQPPTLLALGGVAFDAQPRDALPTVMPSALTPPGAVRGGEPTRFGELSATGAEVHSVAELFRATFKPGTATPLLGPDADKRHLRDLAPAARFLHVATHGWFASEQLRSTAEPQARGAALRGPTGLSPLVLAGLALAGANQPPDLLGRCPGILTAEELLALNLGQCELAVLSACETSLGVRRAGMGYASLRSALLGAGARRVVTSLWKVPDDATSALMTAFYTRLWQQRMAPHQALWEAKREIRARERSKLRDWAGWVMTGR